MAGGCLLQNSFLSRSASSLTYSANYSPQSQESSPPTGTWKIHNKGKRQGQDACWGEKARTILRDISVSSSGLLQILYPDVSFFKTNK